MEADDDILGISDSEAKESDGGDEVLGVSDSEPSQPARGARLGRPRPALTEGEFGAWLLRGHYKPEGSVAADPGCLPGPAARPLVVGLAHCKWTYEKANDANGGGASGARDPAVSSPHWGMVTYSFEQRWMLQDPTPLPAGWDASQDPCCDELAEFFGDARLSSPIEDVRSVLRSPLPVIFDSILRVPPEVCEAGAFTDAEPLLRVPLRLRTDYSRLVEDNPPRSAIQRWRTEAGVLRKRPAPAMDDLTALRLEYERVLLELPRGSERSSSPKRRKRGLHVTTDLDPIKLVRALGFAVFLRKTADFVEAVEACLSYECDEDVPPGDRKSQKLDPGTSTLVRANARLDAVGMLVDRREVHALLATNQIRSVCINTDASPVVGLELQGVVVDFIMIDGNVKQVIPPGASLTYGHYDVCNKTIAALHALWCVVGPTAKDLRAVCELVVGVTTDHGVEVRTIDMPDVVDAFVAWMGGSSLEEVRHLVRWDARLFPNACRISGWSHMFGNIMRFTAQSCPSWPDILTGLREQVEFWRNESWRKHVQNSARLRGVPDAGLKSFRASFAKWRYETIAAVTKELARVRVYAENVVEVELFQHAQDREKVTKAIGRCKDKKLQIFTEVTEKLLWGPLEAARRWGMTCECEQHVRDRKDGMHHISCPRNGRKLGVAWDFIQTLATDLEETATNLTEEMCEGDKDVCRFLHDMCLQAAAALRLRGKYLGVVPWRFAGAGDPKVAAFCVEQVKSRPLSDHDPVTRKIWGLLQADLEQRAQGGDITPALQHMLDRMGDISLDESGGEGFHRSTNHEHCRARAAKNVHLKRTVRQNKTIRTVKTLMRIYGDRGKDVVAYEWLHWKRLFQIAPKYRWRSKHWKASYTIARIYREDPSADLDWRVAAGTLPDPRPVVPNSASDKEALETEWLVATLDRNAFYSVTHSVEEHTEAGGTEQVERTEYFQVLSIQHPKNKPHLIHTVVSAEDPILINGVSLSVILCQPWVASGVELADGARLVFPETSPEWVAPVRIAHFNDWKRTLQRWTSYSKCAGAPGCLVLADMVAAKPRWPLTDERCPVLTIVDALEQRGWCPENRTVVHTDGTLVYDGRSSTRMRWYFTLLLFKLIRCLPLSSNSIPSQECGSYYRVLLKDIAVDAGLGHKHYMKILNANRAARGKDPLPLDMEDLGPAVPLPAPPRHEGDTVMGLSPDRPKPKKHTRGGHGPIRPGSSGDGAPPGPLPLPPPLRGGAGGGGEPGPVEDGLPPARPDPPPPVEPPPLPPTPQDVVVGVPDEAEETRRPHRRHDFEGTGWRDGLDGSRIRFTQYPNLATGKTYSNWCINCVHPECGVGKTSGTTEEAVNRETWLRILATLHAWRPLHPAKRTGVVSGARWNPPKDEVEAYTREHREALLAIIDEVCCA